MSTAIVFASLTGNTVLVARELEQYLLNLGHIVTVYDALQTRADQLKHYDVVFLGSSTYGDGDLNPISEIFFTMAESEHHSCDHTQFAVFALGDSSYKNFAESGPIILNKLRHFGATVILPLLMLDGPPGEPMMAEVKAWSKRILDQIS